MKKSALAHSSTFFSIGLKLSFLIGFALLTGNGIAQTNTGDESQDLLQQFRAITFLEAELALASKPAIYLVLDLTSNIVQLKAKGMILRELAVAHSSFWGDPLPIKPLVLIKKSSFVKPERVVIKPGEAVDKDSFQIAALELDDMPQRYALELEDNITINVKPHTEGFFPAIGKGFSWLASSISRPFPTLFRKVQGRSLTEIDLWLAYEHAQALYWAFTEGMEVLILTR
jgi:hypothetical protein